MNFWVFKRQDAEQKHQEDIQGHCCIGVVQD
jgi:hypothetical protein